MGDTKKCLMLCAGAAEPARLLWIKDSADPEWTTLDVDYGVKPDVLFDLNDLSHGDKLPFADSSYDEIHCYHSMHMYGQQGDFCGFFNEFNEYWRVLKPGGIFCAVVPAVDGPWAWADPGCTRMIHSINLNYLTEAFYDEGVAVTQRYKPLVNGWWDIAMSREENGIFGFILVKQ